MLIRFASTKYVAPGYQVTLGDSSLRFVISDIEISTKAAASRGNTEFVADDLKALTLGGSQNVYEVEWRSKIQFESEVEAKGGKSTSTVSIYMLSLLTSDCRHPLLHQHLLPYGPVCAVVYPARWP